MSNFKNESLSGVDGTDHFERSADESYAHPSAGAGGFSDGAPHFGKSTTTSSSYDDNTPSYDNNNTNTSSSSYGNTPSYDNNTNTSSSSYGNTGGQDSSRTFGSGRGAENSDGVEQGTAEVISTYGGKQGGHTQEEYTRGGISNEGYSSSGAYDSDKYGGIGGGAGAGEALASTTGDRSSSTADYGRDEYSGTGSRGGLHGGQQGYNDTTTSSGYDQPSSGSKYGYAAGGVGAGAAGAGAYESKYGDDDGSSNNQSGGFSSGQVSDNATGNPKADQAINQVSDKIDERTGDDGFTDVTGGNEPGGGLTGRVKLDKNPVVETKSERSKRDSQGRELDSYGKPYEL